jgi:hypothetical protein
MKLVSLTRCLILLMPSLLLSCRTDVQRTNNPASAATPIVPDWRASDLPSVWRSDEVIDCSKLRLSYEPKPTVETFDIPVPDPLPVHVFLETSGNKVALKKVSVMDTKEIIERYGRSRIVLPPLRDEAETAFAFVHFSVQSRDQLERIRCHQVIWVEWKPRTNPWNRGRQ